MALCISDIGTAIIILFIIYFTFNCICNKEQFNTCNNYKNDYNEDIDDDIELKDKDINRKKIYRDGEYRDIGTYGIDRTNKIKKWYHEVNKLVQLNGGNAKIKEIIKKTN
jgi:hypothetical protein